MRLSGFSIATFFLFSSVIFAQHSSSSAPSAPAPSAPAANPAPAASSASSPSSTSGASSSASASHSSAPSAPAASTAAAAHASSASSSNSNSSKAAPNVRLTDSDAKPEATNPQRDSSDDRVVPAPRVGEKSSREEKEEKKDRTKLGEPGMHRKICAGGPCKECPPGQAAGKHGGCIATSDVTTADTQCSGNQTWNGTACVASVDPCVAFSGRAAIPQNDVRTARQQMQSVCSTNPSGDECDDLKQQYDGAVQRYRMLLNEAPATCRATLPDALSL